MQKKETKCTVFSETLGRCCLTFNPTKTNEEAVINQVLCCTLPLMFNPVVCLIKQCPEVQRSYKDRCFIFEASYLFLSKSVHTQNLCNTSVLYLRLHCVLWTCSFRRKSIFLTMLDYLLRRTHHRALHLPPKNIHFFPFIYIKAIHP